MRIPYISLVAAGAMVLGGCAYEGLGMGLGYGSPYGYGYGDPYGRGYGYGSPYYGGRSGISVGVGYGSGYYGGYGSPYYGGYGYGSPYYGWYDDYYYPGTGSYVYDSYRRPRVMTTSQRQYWSSRSPALRTNTRTTANVRPNWSGFTHKSNATTRRASREETRDDRRTGHLNH